MRLEKCFWAAFLIPTLLPGLKAGVSTTELVAIVSCLFAGAVLTLNYLRATKWPVAIWLLVLYLALSFVGLIHDSPNYFLSHFAGGLAFLIALVVGACAPARIRGAIVQGLFLLLLTGAALDIAFDLAGWSPMAERPMAGWEAGARGVATGRSLNGMYLAPVMAFMIVAAPTVKWRVLGATSLLLVFYHVVVFGQGRGVASLALFGILAVLTRELRSLPVALLVLGPFMILLATGFFYEATAPFIGRVTSQNLSEIDRIHHASVGERLVTNMSGEEVLFGMDYKKVFIANGGISMHNAFFDTLTRYGLFVTAPWLVFNVVLLIASGAILLRRGIEREQSIAAVVALQMLGMSMAAPIFINWRSCVIPGICTGLVLRAFQSEGQQWNHS